MRVDKFDALYIFAGLIGGFIIMKSYGNTKVSGSAWIDSAAQSIGTLLARGLRNNNPFNIRITSAPWQGKVSPNTDGAFEQFDTPENGIRAGMKILHNYLGQGVNTIEKMVTRFAPATENDTAAYIAAVSKDSGIPLGQVVTDADIPALAVAIIKHENGAQPYSVATLSAAWQSTGLVA